VGVVGLQDMVMTDEDYEMKLKRLKNKELGVNF